MKNLLLKSMIVSCALSVNAMEELEQVTTGEPLKFQVIKDSTSIEDAPDSNLISAFRESVQRVDKVLGGLEEKIAGEVALVDKALIQFQTDSIEYKGTAIFRQKLVGKSEDLKKKRQSNLQLESFLQKILTAIYKPDEEVPCSRQFHVPVPDFEKLTAKPFKDVEIDFSYAGGTQGVDTTGKSFFILQIDSPLPMDLDNQLYPLFHHHQLQYKLIRTQKDMFNYAELMYHVATETCSSLKELHLVQLEVATKSAEKKGISVLDFLNEQVESYNKKAVENILPRLEVYYLMAKAIIAFESEAPRLRSLP